MSSQITEPASSGRDGRMRLLTLRQVREIIPYTAQHIYRLERAGKFPRRLKLGPNRVAWRQSDIDAWIESRPYAALSPPGEDS